MRLFKRLKLALITAAVSVGAPAALSINVNDGVGVAEDIAPQIQVYEVAVDDGVGLVDNISINIPALEINVADGVGVGEDTSVAFDKYLVSVDDGIGVAESITVTVTSVTLEVDVYDSVGLNDSDLLPWLGINSSQYEDHCGEEVGKTLANALDGSDYWEHLVNHTHYFVIDLGQTYNVTRVRGRSNRVFDPTDINIYVSDDTGDWGAAVESGITTWQGTNDFVEIDITDTEGRYVKVEIVSTESASDYIQFGHADGITIFDVSIDSPALTVVIISALDVNVSDDIGVAEDVTVAIPIPDLEVNVSDDVSIEDYRETSHLYWFGVAGVHLNDFCGEHASFPLDDALDNIGGNDVWYHGVTHTHWFYIDLGVAYNVHRVRGRSSTSNDPLDVNIYVSNDTGSWGSAVATGINTWYNTSTWQEVGTVSKSGRYVQVEIVDTEGGSGPDYIGWGFGFAGGPIFDVYVETEKPLLSVDVRDGVGVADDAAAELQLYTVYVSDDVGVADNTEAALAYRIDLDDDIGVADVSSVEIPILAVSVYDDIGVATVTASFFNLFIINVSDDVGVVTNTTPIRSLGVVTDNIGIADYSLLQIQILEVSIYDGIGLVDWRLHNIPDAVPTTTVDLFRFPRIPSDTDEKLKQFLIELESALRTVLTGDSYVGGTINADGSKIGDVANYVEVDSNGILIFHGRSGLIHGCLFGDHVAWAQANAVQNTWYPILDADIVTGHMKGGVTQSSGKFTVENEGQYMISYHIVYESNAANKHVETGIEISDSGTPDLYGRDHSEVKFPNEEDHMIGGTVINVPAGGTLNIMIRTIDTGTPNLSVQNVNMEVLQIGGLG